MRLNSEVEDVAYDDDIRCGGSASSVELDLMKTVDPFTELD